MIGSRYPLADEETEALRSGGVDAELSERRIPRTTGSGGVSNNLTAVSEEMRDDGHTQAAVTLDRTSRLTRQSIRALRTLMVDI